MLRNKDHMYTSVSRETLSLDSCYRWWLIIRARPRSLSSDTTREKKSKRGGERNKRGTGNLVVVVFAINYSSACRFCFAGRAYAISRECGCIDKAGTGSRRAKSRLSLSPLPSLPHSLSLIVVSHALVVNLWWYSAPESETTRMPMTVWLEFPLDKLV